MDNEIIEETILFDIDDTETNETTQTILVEQIDYTEQLNEIKALQQQSNIMLFSIGIGIYAILIFKGVKELFNGIY